MLSPVDSKDVVKSLLERFEVYAAVLRSAEEEGNGAKSRRYKRILKQYEDVIKSYKNGRVVPLDELPNPPGFPSLVNQSGATTPSRVPNSPNLGVSVTPESTTPIPSPSMVKKIIADIPRDRSECEELENVSTPAAISVTNENSEPVPAIFWSADDLDPEDVSNPEKLLNALTSRLDVYVSVQTKADEEGNSSKSRRYKRIVKQYQDAMKSVNLGKNIDLSELPNPPGFKPLVRLPKSAPPSPVPDKKAVSNEPSGITKTTPTSNKEGTSSKSPMSRAERQTILLKERQQEYKEAALNAKKLGQMNEAKEFLKLYKGFDKLIQASEGGFPVDMLSIPVSLKAKLQVEEDFHIVTESDFMDSSQNELFEKLEAELTEQIKKCLQYKNNFHYNGDVANSNKFETYALNFKKDLNHVKACSKRGDQVPKFHYENKTFTIIQCFNDLTDNELEMTIVQGLNYNVQNPEDVDTYVKYEFPYPTENTPKGKTELIKNTNSPQYNFKFKFAINRDSKVCQRLFKRQSCAIKLEVMSRGGFLRSDVLIGNVSVKLFPLLSELMIHDAYDIVNGRRSFGKLEVKIRIREPLGSKKIEQVQEKWIIID